MQHRRYYARHSQRAASDTVTHGTWIVVAVAIGALTVGALAIPGGPVHRWLNCNIGSIADITGNGAVTAQCGVGGNSTTSSGSPDSTTVSLLGNSALAFDNTWGNMWEELSDTGTAPPTNTVSNAAGVYQSIEEEDLGGSPGPVVMLDFETPGTTYQTLSFSGYSYNGIPTDAEPEIEAIVDQSGTLSDIPLPSSSWDSNPIKSGFTDSPTAKSISLPADTIGVRWGLAETSSEYTFYADEWDFTLQNPQLTS